jgi:serine/threonine protein kinase
LVEKLARAVQAAHDAGIIHRDLKPANVLLSGGRRPPESSPPTVSGGSRPPLSDVTPKITDFGLAKQLDVDSGQTKSGAILGTPSYMAPEQAAGKTKAIGPATDVYALGAILYECLTGRPPFPAATPLDTIIQVVGEEPVPVSRLQTRTPIDLETITLKCLSKKPERRYGTSSALADDLRRFLESRPVVASRPSFLTQVRYWMRRPERVRDAGVLLLIIMLLQVPGVLNSLLLITGSEVRGIDRSLFCFTLPFMLFSVCVGYQTIRAKRWAIWAGLISRLILLPSLPLSILLPRWTGPGSINHELTIHEYGYMIQGVGYMFIPLCAYCLALYAYYSNREYFMDAGRSSGSPSPGLR